MTNGKTDWENSYSEARALHIHAAADQKIVPIAPAIKPALFFRGKHDQVFISRFAKPPAKLGLGMMMLIPVGHTNHKYRKPDFRNRDGC